VGEIKLFSLYTAVLQHEVVETTVLNLFLTQETYSTNLNSQTFKHTLSTH